MYTVREVILAIYNYLYHRRIIVGTSLHISVCIQREDPFVHRLALVKEDSIATSRIDDTTNRRPVTVGILSEIISCSSYVYITQATLHIYIYIYPETHDHVLDSFIQRALFFVQCHTIPSTCETMSSYPRIKLQPTNQPTNHEKWNTKYEHWLAKAYSWTPSWTSLIQTT
jgi:hypothetical protein